MVWCSIFLDRRVLSINMGESIQVLPIEDCLPYFRFRL
jgi:hypothetical protein